MKSSIRRDVAKGSFMLKKWLGNFALLFFGLVMALLVLEGALRSYSLIKFGTIEPYAGGSFVRDPVTGLRVPVSGSKTDRIEINNFGFRGPDLVTPKPSRTIRIAFLGDQQRFVPK